MGPVRSGSQVLNIEPENTAVSGAGRVVNSSEELKISSTRRRTEEDEVKNVVKVKSPSVCDSETVTEKFLIL